MIHLPVASPHQTIPLQLHLLEGAPKVEGIAVLMDAADWVFTLVTDPDDPAVASQLLQVRLAQS